MKTNYNSVLTEFKMKGIRFISLLVGVVAVALCVMPSVNAQHRLVPTRGEETPLTQPLATNDPRARLSPELQQVQPMSYPVYGGRANEVEVGRLSVEYDVPTARATTVVNETSPAGRYRLDSLATTAQQWPGSIGPDARVDTRNAGATPESVIGPDNRVRISNTTAFPWRTMTKLYMTFPNGSRYMASGVLIGAKYVLTAGHVVYSASDGGWAKTIEVIPGLNGTYKPYGSAFASNLRTYAGWAQYADSDYDLALITLDRSIGNSTGWFGYGYFPSVNKSWANLAGYPGDRDNGLNLYYDAGSISSSTTMRVSYPIDTAGGQSGSGVYRIENNQYYVLAVHTNGGASNNSGTRITSQRFNDLKSWIASGK